MTARHDGIIAAMILGGWAVVVIVLRWGAWAPDLSAVVIAAAQWQAGARELIYAAPPGFFGGAPEAWGPLMAGLGLEGRESFAYVYPPVWAALLAPLTVWGVQPVLDAFTLLHVALLVASVVLAGRLARPEGWSRTRWALFGTGVLTLSLPALHALMHNQPTILTGFLVLLAAERLASGRAATAGAALALAAAIKLTPAVFVVVLLTAKSGRGLAGFAVTALGIAAVSFGLAGWPAHLQFLEALRAASEQTLLLAINLSGEAAVLGLGAWAGLWSWPAALPAAVTAPGWIGAGMALTGAALTGALIWRWRGQPGGGLAVLIGLAVLVPLTGPLGWLHYYIVPLLLAPGLLRLLAPKVAVPVLGAVLLGAFAPAFMLARGLPGFDIGFVVIGSALWLAVPLALVLAPRRA